MRAFSDFLVNWSFGRGVTFKTSRATSAVVPSLLNRVWTVDNDRPTVLWEMGNMGSVTGDCFVKVAYQEPQMYPPQPVPGVQQRFMPGRVRILSLNSSFCFPEFAPHDRERIIRFKQKYRFWGCHTPDVEALTRRGWKTYDQIQPDDELLCLDPETDEIHWMPHQGVRVYDYNGEMVQWSGRVDALATPNHRWLGERQRGRNATLRYEREVIHGEFVHEMRHGSRLVVGGGSPLCFPDQPKWTDELVETVGWYVTEGADHVNQTGYHAVHLGQKGQSGLADLRRLAAWWRQQGATFSEGRPRRNGLIEFYLGKGVVSALQEVSPRKKLTAEFLCSLTYRQALLLRDVLLDGDGCRTHGDRQTVRWTQIDGPRKDAYQMLCAMLGIRTHQRDPQKVQEYASRYVGTQYLNEQRVLYTGKVWCPTVPTGFFMARRNGVTYWTGNTTPEGTRQVFTYTELITDLAIEEYVNDNILEGSPRPNPLGMVPIVHIRNRIVSGSPWGLSDTDPILTINRTYNELSTEILDILNYYVAPITIITGGRLQTMERGARKMYAFPNPDTQVHNLEGGVAGLAAAHEELDRLKADMYALVGVPEGALGAVQPISNTTGVALAINYLPTTAVHNHKKMTYGRGIPQINELVLRTLAQKEPETAMWSPDLDEELKEGQLPVLDWEDPVTYRTEVVWPAPLPTDVIAKLAEIQQKMTMGLESKRGALADLGEEFPDAKLAEVLDELKGDAEDQGALDLIRALVARAVSESTGFVPGPDGPMPMEVSSAGGPDVNASSQASQPDASGAFPIQSPVPPPGMDDETFRRIQEHVNMRAFGTNPGRMKMPMAERSD